MRSNYRIIGQFTDHMIALAIGLGRIARVVLIQNNQIFSSSLKDNLHPTSPIECRMVLKEGCETIRLNCALMQLKFFFRSDCSIVEGLSPRFATYGQRMLRCCPSLGALLNNRQKQ